jgi:hypothetical protein
MPAGVSAYTALANVTLGSSAASVTFSSIAAGLYRDLVFVMQIGTSTGTDVLYQFNSDTTASNYPSVLMQGDGSSTFSGSASNNRILDVSTSNEFTVVYNLFDYATTDKQKSYLYRTGRASAKVQAMAGRWANTAAITQIVFTPVSGTFNTGSTFALYGVSA